MISNIQQLYRKLLRTGLSSDAQFKEKLRVKLSNQFILLGLLCVILHNIVNLLFLHAWVDFYLTMVWFSVLFIALLLNMAHKPIAARISLTFGGVLAVFTLHLLFGGGLKLESMYILFLVVATLFFEFALMVKCAIFIISLFITASIANAYQQPVLEHLVNPSGAFTRFVFSVVMITSLIGKLVLENRRYNALVIDQNENLNRYNQQLESFNYVVSHDLKEPLRVIVGFSQLIKRDFDKGKAGNEEYLDYVIRSTKQLNKLVDDLKDFTKSEQKSASEEIVRIDELVREICENSSEISAKEGAEVVCQPFPAIRSSKLALTIVLRNLIENGIKYNDKAKPKVIIEGGVNNDMVNIRIKDNGVGIEEKYFEEIFEMFKRINTDYIKGSGLGLNISRNLIRGMNGEMLIAHSQVGEGTTFQLDFPAKTTV